MTDISFYAESIINGDLLGLRADAKPGDVRNALGSDFIDDTRKRYKRLDYGLAEFNFARAEGIWLPEGATIQVHRLAHNAHAIHIPQSIQKYGKFSKYLVGQDLLKAIMDRIGEQAPWERPGWGMTSRSIHAELARTFM